MIGQLVWVTLCGITVLWTIYLVFIALLRITKRNWRDTPPKKSTLKDGGKKF